MSRSLLTGSSTAREKAQLKKLVAAGLAHVVVGTHALLENDVEFKQAGSGDRRRAAPLRRGAAAGAGARRACHPDVLVMTATPIPRTLAMTIYGDLDVCVIDELPPGRKPIVTNHVTADQVEQVYSFLKKQIDAGTAGVRRVSGDRGVGNASHESGAKDARASFTDRVSRSGGGTAARHCAAAEKEAAMEQFQRGETKILVSTTVIEVGVDVPNASVMVIEQAERFGLAQMHQLARARGSRRRAELLHPGNGEDERHRRASAFERWWIRTTDSISPRWI